MAVARIQAAFRIADEGEGFPAMLEPETRATPAALLAGAGLAWQRSLLHRRLERGSPVAAREKSMMRSASSRLKARFGRLRFFYLNMP